jgi:hypothetical protein
LPSPLIVFIGSVPVYLGDAARLKELLPDPKAAIYESDFGGNHTALTNYLLYLQGNETAYEEHREWRRTYSAKKFIDGNTHLSRPWQCKICDWAVTEAPVHHKRHRVCGHNHNPPNDGSSAANVPPDVTVNALTKIADLEGKAVRGNSRKVYLVKNGMIHFIPDLATFTALNLSFEGIVVLPDHELAALKEGKPLHKQTA